MTLDEQPWFDWLRSVVLDAQGSERARISATDLEALTGQDMRALAAIASVWELYAAADENGQALALAAAAILLRAMQPKAFPVARALIARSLDWHDMAVIWELFEAMPGLLKGASW